MVNYEFFFREWEENGYLSNWYKSDMVIDGIPYNCVEQYMMYQKAVLFKDYDIADEILKSKDQKEIKALGRKVRGFDDKIWEHYRYDIVKRGVIGKFMCNDELMLKFLKYSPETIFVECSPWDKVWGIGLGIEDKRRYDETAWQGMNLLGKVLTEVRVLFESW